MLRMELYHCVTLLVFVYVVSFFPYRPCWDINWILKLSWHEFNSSLYETVSYEKMFPLIVLHVTFQSNSSEIWRYCHPFHLPLQVSNLMPGNTLLTHHHFYLLIMNISHFLLEILNYTLSTISHVTHSQHYRY